MRNTATVLLRPFVTIRSDTPTKFVVTLQYIIEVKFHAKKIETRLRFKRNVVHTPATIPFEKYPSSYCVLCKLSLHRLNWKFETGTATTDHLAHATVITPNLTAR